MNTQDQDITSMSTKALQQLREATSEANQKARQQQTAISNKIEEHYHSIALLKKELQKKDTEKAERQRFYETIGRELQQRKQARSA